MRTLVPVCLAKWQMLCTGGDGCPHRRHHTLDPHTRAPQHIMITCLVWPASDIRVLGLLIAEWEGQCHHDSLSPKVTV